MAADTSSLCTWSKDTEASVHGEESRKKKGTPSRAKKEEVRRMSKDGSKSYPSWVGVCHKLPLASKSFLTLTLYFVSFPIRTYRDKFHSAKQYSSLYKKSQQQKCKQFGHYKKELNSLVFFRKSVYCKKSRF